MSARKELFKYFDYLYDKGHRHYDDLSTGEKFELTLKIIIHEPCWELESSEIRSPEFREFMWAVSNFMMSLLTLDKEERKDAEIILHETIRYNIPEVFRHKINAMFDIKQTDIRESREDYNYDQWKDKRIEAAKAELANTESAS
jgi:hypothetical protein